MACPAFDIVKSTYINECGVTRRLEEEGGNAREDILMSMRSQ